MTRLVALLGLSWALLASAGGCGGGKAAPDGGTGGGGGSVGADNPCRFTISGDVSDRVELNAHLRVVRQTTTTRKLAVDCLKDPPGSQQSGNFPAFEVSPLMASGSGDYVTDGATPDSGRVVVGARAGGPVFILEGGGGGAGSCTFAVTAPAAPAVGDRVDASFHCEGLVTVFIGTTYRADVSDGAFGGTLEYVE